MTGGWNKEQQRGEYEEKSAGIRGKEDKEKDGEKMYPSVQFDCLFRREKFCLYLADTKDERCVVCFGFCNHVSRSVYTTCHVSDKQQ